MFCPLEQHDRVWMNILVHEECQKISDNLGSITGSERVDLPPLTSYQALSSGLLLLSSNLTCLWNEKADLGSHTEQLLCIDWWYLEVCWKLPGIILPCCWKQLQKARLPWPAKDSSSARTWSCNFWIDCWCSLSLCCRLLCTELSWCWYSNMAWPMACCISASRWLCRAMISCCLAKDSTSAALRASEASCTNFSLLCEPRLQLLLVLLKSFVDILVSQSSVMEVPDSSSKFAIWLAFALSSELGVCGDSPDSGCLVWC